MGGVGLVGAQRLQLLRCRCRTVAGRETAVEHVVYEMDHIGNVYSLGSVAINITFFGTRRFGATLEEVAYQINKIGDVDYVAGVKIDIATDRVLTASGITGIANAVAVGISLARIID